MRLLRNDTDQTLEFGYDREDEPGKGSSSKNSSLENKVLTLVKRIKAERRLEEDEKFQEAISYG